MIKMASIEKISKFINKVGSDMAQKRKQHRAVSKTQCDREFESLIENLRKEYRSIFCKK